MTTNKKAPVAYATLTMAKNELPPVLLASSTITDLPLTEHANTTVKALSIVGYRGSVSFTAYKNDGTPLWAMVVTFTDDIPNGTVTHTKYEKGKPG